MKNAFKIYGSMFLFMFMGSLIFSAINRESARPSLIKAAISGALFVLSIVLTEVLLSRRRNAELQILGALSAAQSNRLYQSELKLRMKIRFCFLSRNLRRLMRRDYIQRYYDNTPEHDGWSRRRKRCVSLTEAGAHRLAYIESRVLGKAVHESA